MSEPWRNDERIANAPVRISHVRVDGELVRTVATIEDDEHVHVGVALRHPNDRSFSRKMGRTISAGRARFALAQALKLTEREGQYSRYNVISSVPKDDFPAFARDLGINIPETQDEAA